jgi:hypothetical protein
LKSAKEERMTEPTGGGGSDNQAALREELKSVRDSIQKLEDALLQLDDKSQKYADVKQRLERTEAEAHRIGELILKVAEVDLQKEQEKTKQAEAQSKRYKLVPESIPRVKASVYLFLDTDSSPIGVAFFISPRRAITCEHNLKGYAETEDMQVTSQYSNVKLTIQDSKGTDVLVRVISFDAEKDYAILEPIDPTFSSEYLEITEVGDETEVEYFTLVTYQVTLAKELKCDKFKLSIAFHTASVYQVTDNHFIYEAQTFSGDSGGAIILSSNGKVLGMPLQTENEKKPKRRKSWMIFYLLFRLLFVQRVLQVWWRYVWTN